MITIEGIIYKLIGGIYYVRADDKNYECRARGLFRLNQIKPLVGDRVVIEPDQFEADKGFIVDVLPRTSQLVRPPVANVDQAIIVVAIKRPKPNIHLLDKMLLSCEIAGVTPVIILNKSDLIKGAADADILKAIYQPTGYRIVETSAVLSLHLDMLQDILRDHVSVFAGPSGVGKSSLLNAIIPNIALETGEISKKIKRGKHTTRHTELIALPSGGYVLDTPGFTSLDVSGISKYDLDHYFPEIARYATGCKFHDCMHVKEPDCAVLAACQAGAIHASRYQSYQMILSQLQSDRY